MVILKLSKNMSSGAFCGEYEISNFLAFTARAKKTFFTATSLSLSRT
jgi:hypothetical protein